MRRNSAPARPGAELRKSIHTELSTRIIYRSSLDRARSSSSLSSRLSRSSSIVAKDAFRLSERTSSSSARHDFTLGLQRVSLRALRTRFRQSRCSFFPCDEHTPFPNNLVYVSPGETRFWIKRLGLFSRKSSSCRNGYAFLATERSVCCIIPGAGATFGHRGIMNEQFWGSPSC